MVGNRFDLAIIGGGTAGYSAALRASELGLKVALIEKDKLGGTCLHRGCIPTKSLLHSAELLETLGHMSSFGIKTSKAVVEWDGVMSAKQGVVDKLHRGVQALLKAREVTVIPGHARFAAPDVLAVDVAAGPESVNAAHVVIATGSYPKTLPGLEIDGDSVITSDEALVLDHVPGAVVILGGGSVGVEFASLFRSFGAEVTIVELLSQLLPMQDHEIAVALAGAFEERRITVLTDSGFKSLERGDGRLRVAVESRGAVRTLPADILMVAVGRGAVTEGAGLETIGVRTERGFVSVNENLETSVANVYAIGDVIDTPQLAHVAFAEGINVAERVAGLEPAPLNYEQIPWCVYSYPEVASVGLTEEQALNRGMEVQVARFPFQANSKASIAGEEVGEAKIVARKDGPVLGVHLIGAHVTELISEAMLATNWEALPDDVARLIHPHPTFSEALGEAAMRLAGKPLHSL